MAGFSISNNALVNFVKESRDELKRGVWPSKKAVIRDTLIVIGISAGVAIFLGALDFGLARGVEVVLERFQS